MAKDTPPDIEPTIEDLKARIAALEADNQKKDAAIVETTGALAQFDRTRTLSEKERDLVREKIAAGLDMTMAMEAARNQIKQDEYDANPSNSTAAKNLADLVASKVKDVASKK